VTENAIPNAKLVRNSHASEARDVRDVDLTFLLTARGRQLLEEADASYDESIVMQVSTRLRHGGAYTPEEVAAVLTQAALRRAAVTKFGPPAARMYFTAVGLEQATHPLVAAHRAERARGGCEDVPCPAAADLGCGIGSDLLAFARAGFRVSGVEADPGTAAVARANLAAYDLPGEVVTGSAEAVDPAPYDVVFADPARRRGTVRVFDPQAFSPSWDFIRSLLTRAGSPPVARVVVKLGPGLDHDLIPAGVESEWVSLRGELKEVALWSPATGRVRRRATVLDASGQAASLTDVASTDGMRDGLPAYTGGGREPAPYIYEPDPAVVRSHLVGAVIELVGGWLLDPHLAYVAADRAVITPFARGFRVVDVLPFKEKALRAALRARDIGPLTIKKRGVSVTPEELRRRLALRGSREATIILSRTPRSAIALLVEPLQPPLHE
jgi:SAM-dependent methyltransferase